MSADGPPDPETAARAEGFGAARAVALRTDLATVARGGALNLFGVVANTLLNFVLVLIIARGFGATANGLFFESVALFSLLTTVAQWGAETGVVRTIPRFRVLGRTEDVRHSLRAGLVPVAVAGTAFGAAMFVWAEPLGRLLTNGQHASELAPIARVMAPFVPVGAAYTVALAATRGFGSMLPSVAIDKLGRAAAQPALALLVVTAGWSSVALAVAWTSPMAIGLAATLAWTLVLLRRWERESAGGIADARGRQHTFREFWRFTAPRGLASVFAVSILWLDTLLLGALRSPEEAGVYAVATRYLAVGQFIGVALVQVVAPKLSELLALGDRDRARSVYATTTTWLMLAAWPLYLTMILMAPALLSVFGDRYQEAQDAIAILGGAMLVATAVGPVDMVLLMAGKSAWNLANTVVALTANVVLNLLLIPDFGLRGAATAWGVSILLNNFLPLLQVKRFVGIHPFGIGTAVAGSIAIASFGVAEVVVRTWIGEDLPALVVAAALGVLVFLGLVAISRRWLDLRAFRDAARPGRVPAG